MYDIPDQTVITAATAIKMYVAMCPSHISGSIIAVSMKNICVQVFILPSQLAATTFLSGLDATTRRILVTASSRRSTIINVQKKSTEKIIEFAAPVAASKESDASAARTRNLYASGSRNLPKSVIR